MLSGRKPFLLAAVIFAVLYASVYGDQVWAAEKRGAPVVRVEKDKTESEVIVESDILYEDWEGYIPDGVYTDLSGKQYWLKDWRMETCTIPERRERAERTVLYEGVEWEVQIPKQAAVTSRDRITGLQFQKNFPILQMECDREYWLSDFSFTAVFHSYGADYYQLGEMKIPFNRLKPELKGGEQELLAEIGVKTDRYRILDADWEGDPYLDEGGSLCRNANVSGEKKVADYQVTYGGEIVFPQASGVKCIAVYRGFDSVTEGWKPAEDQFTEPENIFSEIGKNKDKWLVFRKSMVITLSIVLVGGVIILSIYLMQKICHKKESEL